MRLIALAALLLVSFGLRAEGGGRLWLRFDETAFAETAVTTRERHPSVELARRELAAYWQGGPVELRVERRLSGLKEGFRITTDGKRTIIAAGRPAGVLYGAFHLLRLQQTGAVFADVEQIPRYDLRMLNHWDNLDGSIERGYAGRSLWLWDELPETLSPRYEQYARANASVGINATVLNNVNASPRILTREYLDKVKSLADVFRPWGIRVFLSVNFASPHELGGTADSDPFNPAVAAWWRDKVREIYSFVPDFGGFLVKANSEGLPGPHDYGRTHAQGANMLADALAPHGGVVMWRAFVYNPDGEDRAKQAYRDFVPLDGEFRPNVIIQIKNGPIDFQPREPFSPLFGAMRQTAQMVELQITQEYLGQANHLVYLAPLFKEALDADTWCEGEGSTVARVTDGSLRTATVTAIAGVANTGNDANWCGHHFAQANWYAFGRLAWDPDLSSAQIADEWLRMTFCTDPHFVEPAKEMMLASREAAVDYMMPLGLHHIFAYDHHYGPQPWCDVSGARPDWMPWYYHNASAAGIGFDRSPTGSDAVGQYSPPLAGLYGDPHTCPDELLLWFHHLPWNFRMKDGSTLWDAMCRRYDAGVRSVRDFQKRWDSLEPFVDSARFASVRSKLRIQARDAVWWRDACLLYFQTFSARPIPYDLERPVHDLEELIGN